MSFHLLTALLKSSWAIDDRFAIVHGPIVASILNGQIPATDFSEAEKTKNAPYLISDVFQQDPETPIETIPAINHPNICVIPVLGPLMKMDQEECEYFTAGMDTLSNRLVEADKDPNISAIILYIDSPGGTVDGTQAFADKVKNCETPVIAFVDGCMASAALWIGTSANQVIAQNSTTEIGSIGVMCAFADMQPMWEAQGIKFHRITADQSIDKNKEFNDALAGNYKTIKERELNPLAAIFISAIKENRPNLPESVFTGKMYFAQEALSLGLIDSIGDFDFALKTASGLSAKKKTNTPKCNTNIKPKSTTMNFPLLIALLQVSAIEATDDGIFLNSEQIQSIEDALKANAENVQNLISAHQTAIDVANQLASTAESARSAAEEISSSATEIHSAAVASLDSIHPSVASALDIPAKIQAIRNILSKQPGSLPSGIQTQNDPSLSKDGVDWATLNALPHMQNVD